MRKSMGSCGYPLKSKMPKGAGQSPKGDLGEKRGMESVKAGGFKEGSVPRNKLK